MTTSKPAQSVFAAAGNMKNVLRGTDVSDCEQLYCLLGLLIVEGRVPENSESGRSPGPHAHFSFNNNAFKNHLCDLASQNCQMAEQYRERLCDLARRGQPISIQVWLLPECGHYDYIMSATGGNNGHGRDGDNMFQEDMLQLDCPVQDSFLLIEEWIITVSSKRNFSGPIQTVTSLLRTMSSYLHSSKLGNSLCETRGAFPKNVYYRISPSTNSTSHQDNYRNLTFPAINSGESNVLCVCLYSLVSSEAYLSPILCHICSNSPVKISCSTSAASFLAPSTMTKTSTPPEKRVSDAHDKRRGFTLPLHHASNRHRIRKQQIISPMVVCTDQSEQTPPIATVTKNRNHGSIRLNNQPSVIKDLTPYQPKFETFQDVSNSFLDNASRNSASTVTSESHTTLRNKNNSTCHNNQYFFTKNYDLNKLEELSNNFLKNTMVANNIDTGNTAGAHPVGDSSSNSHTPVMKTRPAFRRKSENRIIFTDSSSCESIDKYSNPVVLASNNSTSSFPSTDCSQDCKQSARPTSNSENDKALLDPVKFNLDPTSNPNQSQSLIIHKEPIGDPDVCAIFQREMPYRKHSANPAMIFHKSTGLPLQSSPAPAKRSSSHRMSNQINGSSTDGCYASESISIKHNRSALAMSQHNHQHQHHQQNHGLARLAVTPGVEYYSSNSSSKNASSQHYNSTATTSTDCSNDSCCHDNHPSNSHDLCCLPTNRNLSSSAPVVSSQKLLVNFEESMLNLRIHPVGVINGFEVEIGASGSFNPKHVRLPLLTYFFQLSDDNAPSPYLGFLDLSSLPNRRGYQIPKKGSIQLTLFNPNGAVIKMFVVLYNLSDMPANHQTFLRQRTVYLPVSMATSFPRQHYPRTNSSLLTNSTSHPDTQDWDYQYNNKSSLEELPSFLRYLVHLKIHSSKSGKLYLHTDIRLIFSRDKFEFDPSVATYELRSFVDPPPEPRYSPKN